MSLRAGQGLVWPGRFAAGVPARERARAGAAFQQRAPCASARSRRARAGRARGRPGVHKTQIAHHFGGLSV